MDTQQQTPTKEKQKKKYFFSPIDRKHGEFFSTHKGSTKKVSNKILKFSKLYGHLNLGQKIAISFVLGVIMAILTLILVEESGLYTGGISAFFTGIARFTRVFLYVKHPSMSSQQIELIYTLLYWGLYLMFNIPLFVLAYKKIGHQFAILSLVYLVTLQGCGFMFNQPFCSGLHNLSLLGDTSTVNSVLYDNQVKSLIFYNRWLPSLVSVNPTVVDWTNLVSRSSADVLVTHTIDSANLTRILCLLLYAIVYAIICGISQSILMVSGSSTAGSDIISMYFSEQKNKPVGTILMIINVTGLIAAISLGTYGAGILVNTKYAGIEFFLSGNLVCSALWAVLNSLIINIFFPWKKLVKTEIITTKWAEIKAYLKSIGYPYGLTEVDAVGSYSDTKVKVAVSVNQLIILPRIVKYVRTIDQDALITASYIDGIDGNVNLLRQATTRGLSGKISNSIPKANPPSKQPSSTLAKQKEEKKKES